MVLVVEEFSYNASSTEMNVIDFLEIKTVYAGCFVRFFLVCGSHFPDR